MKIKDWMQSDGRIFLKSEWGPINNDWPCVSFYKKSVGDHLRADFRRGRDVLVYVGTTNKEFTKDSAHRSRLLSAVVIEPNQVLDTQKIVPSEVWQRTLQEQGKVRWPHSMAVIKAADLTANPLPDAYDVIPESYRALGWQTNRGGVVQISKAEREEVMYLEIKEINLTCRDDVRNYIEMMDAVSADIGRRAEQEIIRMAERIRQRVNSGGEKSVRINPQRTAPNITDLNTLLVSKWESQGGDCALCGGGLLSGMHEEGNNPMLQPSADRIDSENGAYSDENVQVTHLACNLAKNKHTDIAFREWLDVVRGEDSPDTDFT